MNQRCRNKEGVKNSRPSSGGQGPTPLRGKTLAEKLVGDGRSQNQLWTVEWSWDALTFSCYVIYVKMLSRLFDT